VAVLLHLGYYASNNIAANPLVSRFYAQVQLLPKQPFYASATRNSVRSRCWYSDTPGCAYQVERCWLVTRTNKQIELQKRSDESLLNQPTYALSNADRQISTRAAAGSSRNKPTSEVRLRACGWRRRPACAQQQARRAGAADAHWGLMPGGGAACGAARGAGQQRALTPRCVCAPRR
jgi:hypothetical protein